MKVLQDACANGKQNNINNYTEIHPKIVAESRLKNVMQQCWKSCQNGSQFLLKFIEHLINNDFEKKCEN